MKTVVTFGEIMLRLQPEGYKRFLQSNKLDMTFAGAEANVAVSLANYGINSKYVTKVPDNAIGHTAINSLRTYGVNTNSVVFGGNRLGLFYSEKGASQRPSIVEYDRKDTSIANANIEDFDWEVIFEGVDWFHFTGITPALSDELVNILEYALQQAKNKGITVSCDMNYRNKLWTKEKAQLVMTKLCQYVDVCIANEEDVYDVLGISSDNSDVNIGIIEVEDYEKIAKQLCEMFPFKYVAFTLRKSISANDNCWSGLLFDGYNSYISKEYQIHIVDRIGGGDSFSAGLIYALINDFSSLDVIEFAVAASCLKQTIEGDYNLVSVNEVLKLMNGNATGRISR